MFGWFSLASALASREKRSVNAGVATQFGREYFQCDKPVQLRLARLVNHSHSALADKLDDFKLRKERRDVRRFGRWTRRFGRVRKLTGHPRGHQAARALAAWRTRLNGRAASRTGSRDNGRGLNNRRRRRLNHILAASTKCVDGQKNYRCPNQGCKTQSEKNDHDFACAHSKH